MVSPDGGVQIARLYDCRRYCVVYGIEVAKVGRWIGISSVWNFQTAVLNWRASVLLECTSFPDGECRSVSYGVMKIRKSVAIVWKCKMGSCEHNYLAMTWAAPIHSKNVSNKPPKRDFYVIQHGRSTSSWNDKLDARGFENWGCKTASRLWLKNARLNCPGWFFLLKKTIILPVPSGVP